ncbi:MAG TPA: sigma-70 family RNA polymerase sigma factor [Actinocrinis sp.]|nr:sigma-70 family RNA polymerase sigma factor [Actinocrinis sp.]
MDELLTRFLPLVYNIVGRALGQRGDVDDVVQDTMLRVVRGLGGLRDPDRFRSWLVAVTMNQVREYRQYRHGGSAVPLEDTHDLADPGADFVDLTLTQLGLSGQRREVAQATCWLDADDRDLLSLWWLEAAGHLTRADLVTALQLNPHLVTVRIARMKGQLELARLVVRALTANPGCPQLAELAGNWPGEPTPLWRKRFARHIRECRYCPSAEAEFVPAERLLAGLSLVPLPSGYSPLPAGLGHFASSPVVRMEPTRRMPAHRAKPRGLRHLSAQLATKPLLGVGVVALVTALSLVAVYLPSQGGGTNTSAGNTPSSAAAVQPSSSVVALPSVTATPGTSASPSASSTPSAAPTPTASPTPSKAATTKPAAPPATKKPSPPSPPTGSQSAADQVLNLINQTRAQQGLAAYTVSSGLVSSAAAHTQVMAGGCGLSHQCPGEAALGDRETAAGVHWTSAGENIGDGGPEANTTSAIAQMAVGLTQDMINEQPPDDGHRLNILSSSFTHIGIVVYRDSSGTVWMTQDFSN